MAQTATGGASDQASDRALFDEIVVTAQRREENLQKVPVAVTAFAPDTLAQQGVMKAEDLQRVTPSLQISRFVGNPAAASFGIRGQRTNDIRMHADPAVIAYVAEVPQKMPFGLGISGFLDLRSIEVLRGPQGTLFGRNSTGGAILLVPNTPTDEFEGSAKFTLGNYKKVEGQAVINVPLGEGVGLRVAGLIGQRDPWYTNRSGLGDFNGEKYQAARGSFQIDKGAFRSIFYGDYMNFNGTGTAAKVVAVNPAGAAGLYPLFTGGGVAAVFAENQSSNFWSSTSSSRLLSKAKVWGVSNTTTYELSDSLLVKNIVGYRDVYARQVTDADGTPFFVIQTDIVSSGWQVSEELQLQYDTDGFRLIGGGFYFKEKGFDGSDGGTEIMRGLSGVALYNIQLKNEAKSLFLEGTYDITPQFHLTLGGRYTWDKRYRSSRSRQDNRLNLANPEQIRCRIIDSATGQPLALANCFSEGSKKFSKATFNITAQYELDSRNQVYASWRRGYRTGGFTLDILTTGSAGDYYRPETVDAYEIGYKGEHELGPDVGLRLNLAAYYSKYDDIQKNQNRSVAVGNSTVLLTETINAAKATIKGIEAEAALNIGQHVKLSGSYTYTDAKYDRFVTLQGDQSSTPWGYQPKHKLTGSARFEAPVGATGSVAFQPTVSYYSKHYVEEIPGPGSLQPSYALVNGRLEYSPNDRLTIAAFANNIFKEKYYVAGNNVYNSVGYTANYLGEPRMYGLELSASF